MLYGLKLIVGVGAYFALSELWLQIRESNSLLSGYEPDVIPYHPSAILEPYRRIELLQPAYKAGHLPLMLVRLVFIAFFVF